MNKNNFSVGNTANALEVKMHRNAIKSEWEEVASFFPLKNLQWENR